MTRKNDWILEEKETPEKAGEEPEAWSRRLLYENLLPDNSNGDWMSPFDYDPLYEVSNTELKENHL